MTSTAPRRGTHAGRLLDRLAAGLRRIPRAAWICALVGVLNCAAWSLLLPAFQSPDEVAHYAYAEYVAQTGRPPADRGPEPARLDLSQDQQRTLDALRFAEIANQPENAGLWSSVQQRRLERTLAAGADRGSGGYSYGATPQPPLFYALQTIPYGLASDGTLLQRLALMRLVSALLGGLTVLFTYLFLREALPAMRFAWTVGALAVAFQPTFAFTSATVNPDGFLYAASAALFLCIARAFRRGLTTRLALATGAVVAVGLVGKLGFIGLLPGAVAGLVLAAWSGPGASVLRRLKPVAVAAAVAGLAMLLAAALNASWDRPAIGLLGSNSGVLGHDPVTHQLSYLWQFYLPRLPGMTAIFDYPTTRDWLDGFLGSFGVLDTMFPPSTRYVALALAAPFVVLLGRGLLGVRAGIRRRWQELLAYGLMTAGTLVLVAAQSYFIDITFGGTGGGAQNRYLLPLLPLYGAAAALAARGAGRRWAPVAGVAIVMLALTHHLLGQLVIVGRYYA